MLQRNNPVVNTFDSAQIAGCGPLIASSFSTTKPLKQLVFEYVRGAGQCARVDVSSSLGVSPASITAISNDLISSGFIHEIITPPREGEPIRGRPPVLLAVRNEAFYVAGIKINDANHTAVILNFGGQIIAHAKLAHNRAHRNAAQTLDEIANVLDAALEKSGIDRTQIAAIGLGIPGLVDTAAGHVVWSPMLNERNVPLASLASQKAWRANLYRQ
ncbi:MAG: hypothetical protein U5K75_11700 [Ahrensia sp.]|nr:hypothetical protein [Ahrensia sp.]